MAGKEGDKKPPAPAPAAGAPKKSVDSSFDGGRKALPPRKPGPPVPSGKVAALPPRPPGVAKPAGAAKPRPFDTLGGEDTQSSGARLPSLAEMQKITGATSKELKPAPDKMLTPFTAAQPALLVKPPTVYQKQRQSSGFDDDERTNTEALLGNAAGPQLDADEEEESTQSTSVHDGMLPAKEVTSVDTWKAVNAPVTSKPGRRSKKVYQNVIEQFACGYNQRYQVDAPTKSKTHILVWDVTRAMNCEIPHFVAGRETTLGAMVDWLRFEGHTRGWKKANAQQAAEAANRGEAVIAIPADSKQRVLAVVRPGELDADGFPRVAAAIEDDGNDMAAPDVMKTKAIAYYVHE